jgi:hypothetical protein
MNSNAILPPGKGPNDPVAKNIDSVAFALNQVAVYLFWIEEHRSSFEAKRNTDPEDAERELGFLAGSTFEAIKHCHRLMELMLAGYHIDADKQLPRGIHETLAALARRMAAE